MLADLYIQSGKYDNAEEFLKKALSHNKVECFGPPPLWGRGAPSLCLCAVA